jgi:O-methyltransferase involved in polyketide biosynthesis
MTSKDDQKSGESAPQAPQTGKDDFIDRSAWPILYVTFPEYLTREGLDRHFAALLRETEKKERFAVIVNLDGLRDQRRELREHAANHLKKLDNSEASSWLVGAAHVSDHWLSRAALTVVLSFSPPPYPNRAFRRMADAEAWIHSLLGTSVAAASAGHE